MELATAAWIPLTVASLINATIALIKLRASRDWLFLLSTITYIVLATGFALLAISAHSRDYGLVDRASLAIYIRSFVFVGGIMRCVLAVLQSNVSIQRSSK